MSETGQWLIFLRQEGERRQTLRIEADRVAPAEAAEPGDRVVLIVPGEQVALHWLPLAAELTGAQAAAAARLMLAEKSAEPIENLHVAAGGEEEGLRCVAAVSADRMRGWIADAEAQGLFPLLIVPEPLLLRPPQQGHVRCNGAPVPIYRGRSSAFCAEDDLARLITGDEVTDVSRDAFEAALPEVLREPMLNLQQGPFARRRLWKADKARLRRSALLLLSLFLLTLAMQIVAAIRYTSAADAAEAESRRLAVSLFGPAAASDPPERILQRLQDARLRGAGFTAAASALFGAVQATPNVELGALSFGDGTLRASARADSPDTIGQLVQRIEVGGYRTQSAPPRMVDGRQNVELVVRPR